MKTVDEIYGEMAAVFAQQTGLEAGTAGDLAVRLYAVAAQVYSLYLQAEWTRRQCFPQTAQGEDLDKHAKLRGVERKSAAPAQGAIRFSVPAAAESDRTIPAGTVCMTAGEVRVRTTEDVVLPTDRLYTDAPAEAVEPGARGNIVPGGVRFLTACPVAVTRVTNLRAFTGGSDDEDDEAFRARILESFQRLPNGANTAWYETTAMAYPGVTAAKAVGRAEGPGTVNVYVTGEGGLPDEALLAGLQAELQEKREIAVTVKALAPTSKAVDVSVQVAPREGADRAAVLAAARQAVTDFFSGRLLGRPVLLAELGNKLYDLEGVENYRFTAPAEDIPADSTVLPVLGTLRVTALEG